MLPEKRLTTAHGHLHIVLTCELCLLMLAATSGGCVYFASPPCPPEELEGGCGLYGSWQVRTLGSEGTDKTQFIHIGRSGRDFLALPDAQKVRTGTGNILFVLVSGANEREQMGVLSGEAGEFTVNGAHFIQFRLLIGAEVSSKKREHEGPEFGLCMYSAAGDDVVKVWMPDTARVEASAKSGLIQATSNENGLIQFTRVAPSAESLKKAIERSGPDLLFGAEPSYELRRLSSLTMKVD